MTPLTCLRLAAIGLALSAYSASATTAVDLELALAIDVSGSIDDEEANLQRAR